MDKIEFIDSNLKQWRNLLNRIFTNKIPPIYIWENYFDIIDILNIVGLDINSNHTFLPGGGGFDLTGCSQSYEKGFLEMKFGTLCGLVNPKKLIFHSLEETHNWSYFRLEAKEVSKTNITKNDVDDVEYLTDLGDGKYAAPDVWEEGSYGFNEDGEPLPLKDNARPIKRYLKGSFVIFAKGSTYNLTSGTYDGRHNKMTDEQFFNHLQEVVNYLKKS